MKQKNISNPQASVLPTLSQQYVRDTEAFIQSNSSYLMDEAFCASSLVDNINVNLSLQNAVRDNKQALLKDIPIVSVVMLEPFNRVMYQATHGYACVDTDKVKDKYSGLKRRKAASPSQGTNN